MAVRHEGANSNPAPHELDPAPHELDPAPQSTGPTPTSTGPTPTSTGPTPTSERTPPTRLTSGAALGLLVMVTAAGALVGALAAGMVIGAVLATLLVRRSRAWVVIPLPPLVFVAVAAVACAVAGHDSARGLVTALGTTVAKAFPALLAATLLAMLLAAVRILANRHPRHDI